MSHRRIRRLLEDGTSPALRRWHRTTSSILSPEMARPGQLLAASVARPLASALEDAIQGQPEDAVALLLCAEAVAHERAVIRRAMRVPGGAEHYLGFVVDGPRAKPI